MNQRIQVTVSSEQEARQLREHIAEVQARLNRDFANRPISCRDPMSVEAAILYGEQCVDYHLSAFPEDPNLQLLAPRLKEQVGNSIRAQAKRALAGK